MPKIVLDNLDLETAERRLCIEALREGGPRLAAAREFQRKAQFLLDFAEAENSAGFQVPHEAARVLGTSIDLARRGLVALWAPED